MEKSYMTDYFGNDDEKMEPLEQKLFDIQTYLESVGFKGHFTFRLVNNKDQIQTFHIALIHQKENKLETTTI